jgi:hypothetical protein
MILTAKEKSKESVNHFINENYYLSFRHGTEFSGRLKIFLIADKAFIQAYQLFSYLVLIKLAY